jgi:hypothetical protein
MYYFLYMLCNCYNEGICKACKYYKNITNIINKADLNVIDPATYIREITNTSFEITNEECEILEKIKNSNINDYSHYKQYLMNPKHYIKYDTRTYIKCPNCEKKMCITIVPITDNVICCSHFINNNTHDTQCMNYNN